MVADASFYSGGKSSVINLYLADISLTLASRDYFLYFTIYLPEMVNTAFFQRFSEVKCLLFT